MSAAADERTATIAANLAEVELRVQAACEAAGRSRESVTLVAVTKNFPAADVRLLAGLGISDVGENRDQEASAKAAELADLTLTWHFVGQLQTNKCRSVATYADVVHSVDRLRLVGALSVAATAAGRSLTCLVQVDLASGGTHGRGGAAPAQLEDLADAIASADNLTLGGLMAVAPLGEDPAVAFDVLASLASRLRADHPEATMVSAGMSADLEQAVAAGSTHLRVGTALLGSRGRLVR